MIMKKEAFLTGFILFLFSLSAFGEGTLGSFTNLLSSTQQTCTWTDNLGPDPRTGITKTAQVTTQVKQRGADGTITYETCKEATDKKQRQVDKGRANRNANEGIKSGQILECTWTSPALPEFPSQTYTLEKRVTEHDEEGTPKYETCETAQYRKQSQWMKTNFPGIDRQDIEQAVAKEEEKRQNQFQEEQLSR